MPPPLNGRGPGDTVRGAVKAGFTVSESRQPITAVAPKLEAARGRQCGGLTPSPGFQLCHYRHELDWLQRRKN